jgi:DNA-binding NarL/FixJ family response regulator
VKINVILADDHAVVRQGIRSIVENMADDIHVSGEAENGRQVLELARKAPADVYILDIAMPDLNGLETAERLLKADRRRKIILLSMHDNRAFLERALQTGVKGYVLKESAIEEILAAIREVKKGGYFISPKISKYVVRGFLEGGPPDRRGGAVSGLTIKEREILQLIAEGFSNKEIAGKLGRSVHTIHVHRNNIMRKLDIHSQAALVRYALKEGISHL